MIRRLLFLVLIFSVQVASALSCEELTLTTVRLELRPMTSLELTRLVGIISQPEIAKPLNVAHNTKTEIKSALKMKALTIEEAKYEARITLGIFRDDELIGYVSAKMEDETWPDENEFDNKSIRSDQVWYSFSYAIVERYWGRGYVPEAAAKFREFLTAHFEINGLHGQVSLENPSAMNVLTGLGFKKVKSRDGTQHFLWHNIR